MSRERTDPVTADELHHAILNMIAQQFGNRPLDVDTARRALEMTASKLVFNHLEAVAASTRNRQ